MSSLLPAGEPAVLALANGQLFYGESIGAHGCAVGEAVFNTAMTGYQEILSDPSYAGQLITLTYPHIGNVGMNPQDDEAERVQAAALIVKSPPKRASNWRAREDLPTYLKRRGICAMAGIDTRKLTRILRSEGAQAACLLTGALAADREQAGVLALKRAREFSGMAGLDLAKEVSTREVYTWPEGVWSLKPSEQRTESGLVSSEHLPSSPRPALRVLALDFGVKRNILRMFVDRGCEVRVLPAQTGVEAILALEPDGVFLSNGPGDPEPCNYAIETARALMAHAMPLFGICLGHQIMGLASGAKTLKMKFGHHGANHPVKDLKSGAVMITSQNHGFAIDPENLPASLRVTHISLFDGSIQGIERIDCPAFAFQGHPEASPGPHDVSPLFDRFVELMRQNRAQG
ncbi:MAG: carbamoyl-phosphate synthase small subunit [Betaproteobacteria bacterium]|nr:carbamoyl-phosphate synthase small subunit [Betaproteobacteria bacterium]NBO44472.1 carbamoyl-phosphate synthase small subunit [Betaproteobacteria bacterium]NBP10872.1 carbamoyl-phosphate synthase small subunit [Betaproteobacteria bacterium]NBQ09382.1 carbamoyl-phosphate synthase small subunit [Betaproteobacteria bacterium]NBS21858.1 carbamoyl-phosphate synthase small subunit [Betaproteobacteria bacterium]